MFGPAIAAPRGMAQPQSFVQENYEQLRMKPIPTKKKKKRY
jgi:hypothetical protein